MEHGAGSPGMSMASFLDVTTHRCECPTPPGRQPATGFLVLGWRRRRRGGVRRRRRGGGGRPLVDWHASSVRSARRLQVARTNRVGGGITSPVLPHHRTYLAYPAVSV